MIDRHLGMCDFRFLLWSKWELHSSGLLIGLIGCPKMLVMTYHYSLFNSPEQCRSRHLGIYPNLFAKMPFRWPPKQIISISAFTAYISIMTHTILKVKIITYKTLPKLIYWNLWICFFTCSANLSGNLYHLLWTKPETDWFICYECVTRHHKEA